MKTFILGFAFGLLAVSSHAQDDKVRTYQVNNSTNQATVDSVKLHVDGANVYYQNTVKVDSNITVSTIYIRSLQFMASKNFQQNYGYEEEGKLIFTTAQDLNINTVGTGEDYEAVDPYTVQFAITLDMKNHRYRYTIHNVVFFLPTESGNRRLNLYDVYLKANSDSRRVKKDARKLLTSFERYLTALTGELYEGIERKSAIYAPKF